ncbi:hypothetical protein CCHL11_02162 [Colletotrichum chlorophyti]|uniref:Uncharacterized protein n=1 Tax=Colletotrichum chlorophyti TaxID=708187 RepID=A0A1Q8S6K1_9PEZI|nr:hypothetical protein CCHL11_02162 [Colletotrichum chlorophyti]
MNPKVLLTLLFTSAALAVPSHIEDSSNVLARDPQRRRPVNPVASCCGYIPGECDCSCGPCATFTDPNARC